MPASDYPLRLATLGALSVRAADGEELLTGQPALLFTYLVDRGAPQPRAELAALFWPDTEASRARHGLRQALTRIRKAVGEERVVGTDPVGIDRGAVEWDVETLEAALEAGELDRALDLCVGPFLNGAASGLSWELDDWVDRRRRALEAMLLDAGRGRVRGLMRTEDFTGALALVDRLHLCLPGDRGLAVDAAELLLELGRPHEAEARLAVAEVDRTDARVAGLLKRLLRTEPDGIPEAATAPSPTSAPVPASAPASGSPPALPDDAARPARRRRRLVPILLGIAALAVVLIGFFRPAPIPDVSIWFCEERETRYGFRLDLPEGRNQGVLTEPGCPVIPIGDDSVLVVRGEGSPQMWLEVESPGGREVVYRASRIGTRTPFRRAGLQDGIVSPDGRSIVLVVERGERARPTDPTLEGLADEGPIPGTPGLRREPEFQWDVVVLDMRDWTERVIGHPGANHWDPRFTPDGDAIVFVSDAAGPGDLYRTELATGETTQLTSGTSMVRLPVVGRRWTVAAAGSGTDDDPEQIVVLDNETGALRFRTADSWNDLGPDMSPDERHLCWTSKRLGHFEGDIVVASVAGDEPPRRITPAGRDDYCQWVSNDHVMYRSWRAGAGNLFVQGLHRWSRGRNVTFGGSEPTAPFVRPAPSIRPAP